MIEWTKPVAFEKYLKRYPEINPSVADAENLREDMLLLIQEKLRLFPLLIKKPIVDAELKLVDGEQVVTAASMKLPSQ
jgi:hypothetical protein